MAIDADLQAIQAFGAAQPCVLVTLTETKGSTPRVQGTQMLVSGQDVLGTIGGGQLEYMAIDAARAMLTDKIAKQEMAVPLGPDIGQCCGGHVMLTLSTMTESALDALLTQRRTALHKEPSVFIFGAGHVGRALAVALHPLPVTTLLIDNRAEALALASPTTKTRQTALPEALISSAPPGSAFVVLTHDHALDFLITGQALARNTTAHDVAYIGMIGSRTKRATFARWLKSQPGPCPDLNALVMPIGKSEVSDKRPAVIAAMVAAEMFQAVSLWAETTSSDGVQTNQRERLSV